MKQSQNHKIFPKKNLKFRRLDSQFNYETIYSSFIKQGERNKTVLEHNKLIFSRTKTKILSHRFNKKKISLSIPLRIHSSDSKFLNPNHLKQHH